MRSSECELVSEVQESHSRQLASVAKVWIFNECASFFQNRFESVIVATIQGELDLALLVNASDVVESNTRANISEQVESVKRWNSVEELWINRSDSVVAECENVQVWSVLKRNWADAGQIIHRKINVGDVLVTR